MVNVIFRNVTYGFFFCIPNSTSTISTTSVRTIFQRANCSFLEGKGVSWVPFSVLVLLISRCSGYIPRIIPTCLFTPSQKIFLLAKCSHVVI